MPRGVDAATTRRWQVLVLALLAHLFLSGPAAAQVPPGMVADRIGAAVAVLQGKGAATVTFAPNFLAAIPESELQSLAARLQAQGGAITGYDDVAETANGAATFTLTLARAMASAEIRLEPEAPYRITGLRIQNIRLNDDGAQAILNDLRQLPGRTALGLYELEDSGPQPLLISDPAQQLAVGSAFKLYVLSALAREIADGRRKWADVVPLGPPSLPAGIMQDWPPNAPATLHTLATLMISVSDNTATDTLIALLGRETIEAELPQVGHQHPGLNMPFLTTREVFQLKSGSDEILRRFARAEEQQRRDILRQISTQALSRAALDEAFAGKPRAIDVEWFASTDDLARVMNRLRQLEDKTALSILAVNPALQGSNGNSITYAGFKGGSEPGVLNYTWLWQNKSGHWFTLAMTWNNPDAEVDPAAFAILADRARTMALRSRE